MNAGDTHPLQHLLAELRQRISRPHDHVSPYQILSSFSSLACRCMIAAVEDSSLLRLLWLRMALRNGDDRRTRRDMDLADCGCAALAMAGIPRRGVAGKCCSPGGN